MRDSNDFQKVLIACYEFSHNYGHLVGIYLTHEQLQLAQELLTEDDPPCGAFGRYLNIPVFSLSDAHQTTRVLIETDEGITIEVFR